MIFMIFFFCILAVYSPHLNIIIQVSQHSSIFLSSLSITMLTSAFKGKVKSMFLEEHD